jgi:Bacteriophage tail assembly protein
MTFEMNEESQTIKVFNLRADTKEFIGIGDAHIPPHTGLPANCTHIAPPEIKAGYVAVFDDVKNAWACVEDHREQTVYDTKDGSPIFISELGKLPDDVTTIAPYGNYQVWDGDKWIKDKAAEQSALVNEAATTKSHFMTEANNRILPLQDAVDVDMATDEEKAELIKWKKYRVLLNRIDVSLAPDIEWPEKPLIVVVYN